MDALTLWKRYQDLHCRVPSLDLSLDISRMNFSDSFLSEMEPKMQEAHAAMAELEAGAIANPDEKRMVGHYWLRAPKLAPEPGLTQAIEETLATVKGFAAQVHQGTVQPEKAGRFNRVLCIGIGGSALGPMFVADALGHPRTDKMQVDFIDNTDPDGIEILLARIGAGLSETLCLVTSKSGGTPETRNGMIAVSRAYAAAGLSFARHAVAITMPGSKLDQLARKEGWVRCFPMFDWVGGRTSETSAVGLLPAALQGLDVDLLLAGAAACDEATRSPETKNNPAALLALMWYHATSGRGAKDMVVIPYKDRLLLFSRYLQQLVMESLGKRLDLNGDRVDQGISVYGNKGSTDQHAYVQQLRDGINNFFIILIRVLEAGDPDPDTGDEATVGDYLNGFLLGTRTALHANDRESITLTIPRVEARSVGALIALFERAVGFYASLIGINAYHQPGVQAGKKAADDVLKLQRDVLGALSQSGQTAEAVGEQLGDTQNAEAVYLLLEHLAANGRAVAEGDGAPGTVKFKKVG